MGRKYETVRGHPLATKIGRIPAARRILYDMIGPGSHQCVWCAQKLHWRVNQKGGSTYNRDLIVDHLDSNPLNDDEANLVASCQSCNTVRGLTQAWQERTGRPITDLLQ